MVRDFETIAEAFVTGAKGLGDADREYLLDQIEYARWRTGPTYNEGVHILLDVIQSVVESGFHSPNMR
ncbi:hypothetical protein D3C80_440330 [compost metagenome]